MECTAALRGRMNQISASVRTCCLDLTGSCLPLAASFLKSRNGTKNDKKLYGGILFLNLKESIPLKKMLTGQLYLMPEKPIGDIRNLDPVENRWTTTTKHKDTKSLYY